MYDYGISFIHGARKTLNEFVKYETLWQASVEKKVDIVIIRTHQILEGNTYKSRYICLQTHMEDLQLVLSK